MLPRPDARDSIVGKPNRRDAVATEQRPVFPKAKVKVVVAVLLAPDGKIRWVNREYMQEKWRRSVSVAALFPMVNQPLAVVIHVEVGTGDGPAVFNHIGNAFRIGAQNTQTEQGTDDESSNHHQNLLSAYTQQGDDEARPAQGEQYEHKPGRPELNIVGQHEL